MNRRYAVIHGKVRPPSSRRMPWLQLAEAARLLAARADGTDYSTAVHRGDLLTDLRHLRRKVLAKEFAVQQASAVSMATALCATVDAFLEASPERRTMYAPVLSAAAHVIVLLLGEQQAADAAATWQRRLPASERF